MRTYPELKIPGFEQHPYSGDGSPALRAFAHDTTQRDIRSTLSLVLAGGRGTRLHNLTDHRVKPGVPFGGNFRIIDFALSNCINSGIRRIGVLTQYKSQSLIRHILNGWSILNPEMGEFIEVLPAQQWTGDQWYQGTADAIYQNLDVLREYNPRYVLVLCGDHVYKMDYGPIIAFHKAEAADVTVACIEVPRDQASSFGVVTVDESNRIVRFDEKPENPSPAPGRGDRSLVSMGIYVFDAAKLEEFLLADAAREDSGHDFGKDIIPSLVPTHRVVSFQFEDPATGEPGYWRDVGTIDSYWEANMELVSVTPRLNLYDSDWPVRSAVRHYPPAKFVFNEAGRRGLAMDSMVSAGCIISGSYVERSLLFTNVRVLEYASVRQSVILPDVVIEPGCRITHAIIDSNCVIPAGTVIGEDPMADAERFHVSPKGIVLVTPEMLLQPVDAVR